MSEEKGKNLGGTNFSKTDPKHKDYWSTPEWAVKGLAKFLFNQHLIGGEEFTLDVCASELNSKCDYFIDEETDTLITEWGENELCWLNPPYSGVAPFLEKAVAETANGNTTVALLKNDCSTKWFSYAVAHATAVVFIMNGRIGFISALSNERVGGNNFSSVAFVFAPQTSTASVRSCQTLYVTKQQLEELGNE